jgi:hypothetical protein
VQQQGLDERREGQRHFRMTSSSANPHSPMRRSSLNLLKKSRLANACVAVDQEHSRRPRQDLLKPPLSLIQLRLIADKSLLILT